MNKPQEYIKAWENKRKELANWICDPKEQTLFRSETEQLKKDFLKMTSPEDRQEFGQKEFIRELFEEGTCTAKSSYTDKEIHYRLYYREDHWKKNLGKMPPAEVRPTPIPTRIERNK